MEAALVINTVVVLQWIVVLGAFFAVGWGLWQLATPKYKIGIWAAVLGTVGVLVGFGLLLDGSTVLTENRATVEHTFNMEVVSGSVPAHIGEATYVVALLNDTDEYQSCRIYINHDREFEVTCGTDRRWPRDTVRFEIDKEGQ